MAIPYLSCMVLAAAFYHLPPRVLPSIQRVEGGAAGVISHNRDGSDDLGVMQVNTLWLGPVARAAGMSEPATRARLLADACFNIAAAAAILRGYLNQRGGDLMLAVGDYHSHTPALNHAYQLQVVDTATRLFVKPAAR